MSGSDLKIRAHLELDEFTLDLDQRLPLDGVTAVFGPSGSGKTSLLNLIAGFQRSQTGHITFGDRDWVNTSERVWLPAHMRGVGYVFQDAQLFSHLTVQGNLSYALQRAPTDSAGHTESKIVDAMDIRGLLSRHVQSLSGGERQRVAIARTLLTRPQILLLDEPLSALDYARKGDLLPFLETLKSEFSLPTVYVSHDVDEVSRISDRVIVLEQGQVIASGPTDETLSRFGLEAGRNPYEDASVLEGRLDPSMSQDGLVAVRVGTSAIWLAADIDLNGDARVRLKIPARDVSIALERPTAISIQNMIPATVSSITPMKQSAFQSVQLDAAGQTLRATVTRKAVVDLGLAPGKQIFALIKSATFQH